LRHGDLPCEEEQDMTLTEFYAAELEREAPKTRKVLEAVPEGLYDWKPHEKSMIFGYLATLVATMPTWVTLVVNQDELDMSPKDGSEGYKAPELRTRAELVKAFDDGVAGALEALASTTDEQLQRPWRFLVEGKVVQEEPKYITLRDNVLNHLAHHRGQLTVYLRLNDATVPAIYGPSADDSGFA